MMLAATLHSIATDASIAPSTAEPPRDILAQIDAMYHPRNPRDAVFIAESNDVPRYSTSTTWRIERAGGVLLTVNERKATRFGAQPTDAMLAAVLGYPETKEQAFGSVDSRVIQIRDDAGRVVWECLFSWMRKRSAIEAAKHYAQGIQRAEIVVLSAQEVQSRRLVYSGA